MLWYNGSSKDGSTIMIQLALSFGELSERGMLHRYTRDFPTDPWPVNGTLVGKGYSRTSAAKIAHRESLTQDGFDGPAPSQAEAIRRATGESTPQLDAPISGVISRGDGGSAIRRAIETSNEGDTMKANANTSRTRKSSKKVVVNAQSQGFPSCYLGPTGNFKPGYDARAKSDLNAAVTGVKTGKELHTFTKAKAQKLQAARGW